MIDDETCKRFFFSSSDTCELTDHGGEAAGGAAVRSQSHHSVYDCLSA